MEHILIQYWNFMREGPTLEKVLYVVDKVNLENFLWNVSDSGVDQSCRLQPTVTFKLIKWNWHFNWNSEIDIKSTKSGILVLKDSQ